MSDVRFIAGSIAAVRLSLADATYAREVIEGHATHAGTHICIHIHMYRKRGRGRETEVETTVIKLI